MIVLLDDDDGLASLLQQSNRLRFVVAAAEVDPS